MGAVHIPIIDEDKLDDIITALQALSAPSGTDVAISPTGMHIVTEDDVQGAISELDTAVDSVNSSLTKSRGIGAHSFTAYPYGFVTSGATALSLFIPVNIKSEVTNVALTKLDDWAIRIPSGGYLPYSTPTSTEIAIVDGGVRIVLIKTGGWGVTNNINVSGEIESSHLTITFS